MRAVMDRMSRWPVPILVSLALTAGAAASQQPPAAPVQPPSGRHTPAPTAEQLAHPFVEPVKILREWDGEAANDQFGWIARSAGDVDGDGVEDVVTSAPTAAAKAGRIYVYSTKTGARLWTADGLAAGDQLGSGVEGAGDTNRDGIPDVIASAPNGGYARGYSGREGRVLFTVRAPDVNVAVGQHPAGVGYGVGGRRGEG